MRTRLAIGLGALVAIAAVALFALSRGDDDAEIVDLTVGEQALEADTTADDDGEDGMADADPAESASLVLLRSGPDGVDIRVHRVDAGTFECRKDFVRVGVSSALAVGAMEVELPVEDGPHARSTVVGQFENDPIRIVLVSVEPSIIEAQVTYPTGAVDVVAVEGGIVASAARLESEASAGEAEVTLIDAQGGATVVVVPPWTGDAATCASAPPAYPTVTPAPDSPEAPAPDPLDGDRPEDRVAIVEVYAAWYDHSIPNDNKAALLDDPTGVIEAQDVVAEQFGDTIIEADAVVTGIEFVGDAEASVTFEIYVGDQQTPMFTTVGRAVLIDGTWRITRDTVCPLIAQGGGTC